MQDTCRTMSFREYLWTAIPSNLVPFEDPLAWLSLGDCLPWSTLDPSTVSKVASALLIFPSACLTVQQLTQSPGNWSSVQLSSALLQILSVIRNCSQSPSELQRQLLRAHNLCAPLLLVKFSGIWFAEKNSFWPNLYWSKVICKDLEHDWSIV